MYVATAPKSNASYMAIDRALAYVREHPQYQVPDHLRDSHYKGSAKLGRGIGYQYAHDFPGHFVDQQYLPNEVVGERFFEPGKNGYEKDIREYLEKTRWKFEKNSPSTSEMRKK